MISMPVRIVLRRMPSEPAQSVLHDPRRRPDAGGRPRGLGSRGPFRAYTSGRPAPAPRRGPAWPGLVDAVPASCADPTAVRRPPAGDEIDRIEQRHREPNCARARSRPSPMSTGRAQERPAPATSPRSRARSAEEVRCPRPPGRAPWWSRPMGRARRGSGTPAPGGSRDLLAPAKRSPAARSSQAANRWCRSARCSFGIA